MKNDDLIILLFIILKEGCDKEKYLHVYVSSCIKGLGSRDVEKRHDLLEDIYWIVGNKILNWVTFWLRNLF